MNNDIETVLGKIAGDLNAHAEASKAREAKLGVQVAELSTKVVELNAVVMDNAQKLLRRPVGGGDAPGGHSSELLALLEGSTDLQLVADRKLRRAIVELPSNFFKATITEGVGFPVPQRLPGVVVPAQRRMTIRALLPSLNVTSGTFQYVRETSFANTAATVSETTQKPESAILTELKTAAIATIAHFIRASLQVLSDGPQLQNYIENRLRYGVAFAEELQLLKGSGVGSNIQGMLGLATPYAAPFAVASPTKIDKLLLAIAQLHNSEYQATGIVMNPLDWAAMSLQKTTLGEYILSSPADSTAPSLWGIPVIATTAMTVGKFLCADFQQGCLLLDREQSRIDVSTEDADNFQKNLVTIRAEERVGLAILLPGALIVGDFNAT